MVRYILVLIILISLLSGCSNVIKVDGDLLYYKEYKAYLDGVYKTRG